MSLKLIMIHLKNPDTLLSVLKTTVLYTHTEGNSTHVSFLCSPRQYFRSLTKVHLLGDMGSRANVLYVNLKFISHETDVSVPHVKMVALNNYFFFSLYSALLLLSCFLFYLHHHWWCRNPLFLYFIKTAQQNYFTS